MSTSFLALVLVFATPAIVQIPTSMTEEHDETTVVSKVNIADAGRNHRRPQFAQAGQRPASTIYRQFNTDAALRLLSFSPAPFACERCSRLRC